MNGSHGMFAFCNLVRIDGVGTVELGLYILREGRKYGRMICFKSSFKDFKWYRHRP
jgi:hypothetical protein